MDINKLFSDKDHLENEIKLFTKNKHIRISKENAELVVSHLKKARHNMEFFKLNKEYKQFSDWLIVTLYYSLYHCALALITKKKYTSKNHYATILLLIKEYSITKDETKLLNELSLSKEDAELYTTLKGDRHNASYTTNSMFSQEVIEKYESQVIDFINKTEELLGRV